MEQQNRSAASDTARFGYNGMLKDNDMKGEGNSYTTEFRGLDTRTCRWWSLDPKPNASESGYVSMGDNPIKNEDHLGNQFITFGFTFENTTVMPRPFGGQYVDYFIRTAKPAIEVMKDFEVPETSPVIIQPKIDKTPKDNTKVLPKTEPFITPRGKPETETSDDDIPEFIYRGGANTNMNLTPRPGIDDKVWHPKKGLSTFTTPEEAMSESGKDKAQKLSTKSLLEQGFDLRRVGNHVSILPPFGIDQQKKLEEWANSRKKLENKPTDNVHPKTQEVKESIVGEVH